MLVDLLRVCVTDCGWTMDALQTEMRKDKAYINRVLNGEKPMSWDFFIALPDDVRDEFHERLVEARGQIVVKPVEREDAIRLLVSGLCSVLAPQLPAKADRMAKATTAVAEQARKRA